MEHKIIKFKIIPNSSRNSIVGIIEENEVKYIKVKIIAVPEDSKANKALIKFLSKEFKISQSCISILSGLHSRKKIIQIDKTSNELEKWLELL